ncbi:uncharacterized protein LOC133866550 [Alnus glutinosa]|uniref:uncharacterized protein LOC133866550 n=1 Tax=Alnus glutinosa TaxID=3517 RepID=UPI002D76CB98|nr:uncharacterized protein LOC133866550 [Alnus glutinosa]
MDLYSKFQLPINIQESFLEIKGITMEKIGSRKFMSMTTLEMMLIMLVLGVACAGDSLAPFHRQHFLLSVPSSPLPLSLLPLAPSPPRRLFSIPARNDMVMTADTVRKKPKHVKISKVNPETFGIRKRVARNDIIPAGVIRKLPKFFKIPRVNHGFYRIRKRVTNLPVFPKLARTTGKLFNGMMMCEMVCPDPSDQVALDDGLCSVICHPFATLEGKKPGAENYLDPTDPAEKNIPRGEGKPGSGKSGP